MTIFCKKYQKELPKLSQPPFPGEAGQIIYENYSELAWQDWLEHQTRLINEKNLNSMDKKDRLYLKEQRDKFLNNQDFDKAEGHTPKNESDA